MQTNTNIFCARDPIQFRQQGRATGSTCCNDSCGSNTNNIGRRCRPQRLKQAAWCDHQQNRPACTALSSWTCWIPEHVLLSWNRVMWQTQVATWPSCQALFVRRNVCHFPSNRRAAAANAFDKPLNPYEASCPTRQRQRREACDEAA